MNHVRPAGLQKNRGIHHTHLFTCNKRGSFFIFLGNNGNIKSVQSTPAPTLHKDEYKLDTTFLSGLVDSARHQMFNLRPHDVCQGF